jgi:uncharacterized membrane protein
MTQRKADLLCAFLVLGMLLYAAATWSASPASFPVHWNLHGEVDRTGGRAEGLLAMPALAAAMALTLRFLPRIDPGRGNYANFASAYAWVRVLVVALLSGVYVLIQMAARGRQEAVAPAMTFLVGALFVGLGNVLGKVRPNWFVGVRTPWTLSSAESWTRTHRAGGWVFVLAGLGTMAGALRLDAFKVMAGLGIAMLLAVLGLTIYSYVVWRGDPDKVPPAGRIAG